MFFAIDNNDHPLAVKPEDQEESNLDLGEEYTEDKKDDLDDDKDELDLDNHDKNTNKKDEDEDEDEEDDKNSNKDEDDEKDNFKAEIAECELKQPVMYNSNNHFTIFCSDR